MKELSQDIKVSNFAKYKHYLNSLIGEEVVSKLFSYLGEENIMNASFGMNVDSGSAYEGALIENMLKIAEYGVKINDILPESEQVTKQQIYKIALLQHIAKILMYKKNDNKWEIDNRGILYKFNDALDHLTLKCGEYSALMLLLHGVHLEPKEYEALCIMDKVNSGDDSAKWYCCTLSTIIRQANEIVSMINKNNIKRTSEGNN